MRPTRSSASGRLTRAFLELRDLPCDEIARALVQRVGEYAGGGDPEDDRTVVVLKRHAGIAPEERRPTGSAAVAKTAG